jgi:hypothetical protein
MLSRRFICLLGTIAWSCGCFAGEQVAPRFESLSKPGAETFVMALSADRDGSLWLGTEENGLFRVAVDGMATEFTTKSGFADDLVYALCRDQQGRLWAGTLKSGVVVWNGKEWKSYGAGTGPLGERVYSIACNPLDGDVWVGTNAGLTRYSNEGDTWTHFTPADGLPGWDVVSLAFDTDGNLYAGTACNGLAIASARQGYKLWRSVTAATSGLWTARGSGLPSDQINQVLVSKSGVVYAATSAGLAYSTNKGLSWSFVRGADYVARANGLAAGKPSDLRGPKDPTETLPEDYITCLAEDPAGGLWLGFRQKGLALVNPANLQVSAQFTKEKNGLPDDYVKSLLPLSDGRLVVGTYGGGAGILKDAFAMDRGRLARPGSAGILPAPENQTGGSGRDGRAPGTAGVPPAPTPNPESALSRTLKRTLSQQQAAKQGEGERSVEKLAATTPPAASVTVTGNAFPKPAEAKKRDRAWGLPWAIQQSEKARKLGQPFAVALDDDWQTRGDWIGKYGSFYHCLCAVKAPIDWIGGKEAYWVRMRRGIGEHIREFPLRLDEFPPAVQPPKELEGKPIPDSIRCWIHFMKTDIPWALQLPEAMGGGRRQAEWDDHAECYPFTWEGPHLYCDLMIGGKKDDPEDLFLLSFYIVNKDGHQGNNRFRDYLLTVKAADQMPVTKDLPGWEAKWRATPTLAETRIVDFRGGVYKRFLVRRGTYSIRVDKNDSFNTIMSGVFIERAPATGAENGLVSTGKGLSPQEIERYRRLLLGEQGKGD